MSGAKTGRVISFLGALAFVAGLVMMLSSGPGLAVLLAGVVLFLLGGWLERRSTPQEDV